MKVPSLLPTSFNTVVPIDHQARHSNHFPINLLYNQALEELKKDYLQAMYQQYPQQALSIAKVIQEKTWKNPINIRFTLKNETLSIPVLHFVAQWGAITTLLYALSRGKAPVDQKDSDFSTTLHTVLKANEYPFKEDVLACLLDYNPDLTLCDISGNTPLHLAALSNNVSYIKLLLKKPINLKLRNFAGKTPLDCATSDIAKRVLQNKIADKTSEIQHYFATHNNELNEAIEQDQETQFDQLVEVMQTVTQELEHPALLTESPYHTALKQRNPDVRFKFLLKLKKIKSRSPYLFPLDAQNGNGDTALVAAVRALDFYAVQLLLEQGANPNTQTKEGYSLFQMATLNGFGSVVLQLMKHGADTTITPIIDEPKKQETLVDLSNFDTAQFLEE